MTGAAPNHGDRAHANFSPSGSGRWMACPMSVTPSNPAPDSGGSWHTARGTAMHECADQHLANGTNPEEDTRFLEFVDPQDGSTHMLDPDEWHNHVVPLVWGVRAIRDELEFTDTEVELLNEVTIPIQGDDCWGSVDVAIVGDTVLHVVDLKCGSGKIVSADCTQLKTYAVGLCEKYGWRFTDGVVLHIYQYDNFAENGHSVHHITQNELKQHRVDIASAILLSKDAEKKGTEPTEKNINDECHWCPRFAECPAHRARAVKGMEMGDAVGEVADLSIDKLRWLVDKAPLLRELLKAAEERVFDLLHSGRLVLGYKLVAGKSNRKWNPDFDQDAIVADIEGAAGVLGVEVELFERKLTSFTKIEKALGKGAIDHLLVKPEGKPTLVAEDDKRPAIAFNHEDMAL